MKASFDEKEVQRLAARIRLDCLNMTYAQGTEGAHIGGALSLAEILAVLYHSVMRVSPDGRRDEQRDRLILSKGHGAMALYAAMKEEGVLQEELATYKNDGSPLSAHPSRASIPGVEFSSGSLGQGLSLGVGCALGLRRKGNQDARVFVIVGDGECDEGSIWEAAQSAAHFGCRNLVAIVDHNRLQYDGPTEQVMALAPQREKWEAFGWKALQIDGHSAEALYEALSTHSDRPLAIIADTVKGKGVSFMEGRPEWHNHALSAEEFAQAVKEIEASL